MTERRQETNPLHSLPPESSPPEGAQRPTPDSSDDSIDRESSGPQYDPRVPDEVRFHEHERENPGYKETLEGHAEAAETSRGEEMRPKDGTLDPSSAR